MQNFVFQNPVKILFGKGTIPSLTEEVPTHARVLIAYGGGSAEKNGTLAQVRAALPGRALIAFGGIEPNPSYETLIKAVDLARREKVDFLLAVGGGSVIDGTKFIAAAVPFAGEPWQIVQTHGDVVKAALPFGTVLTLPATGSEMNAGAVITRKETKDKLAFFSPLVFPRFSILDPTVTFSLPPRQVANGIVDAFVHVIEQYLTYPDAAPLQDRQAEAILSTLVEVGPQTLRNPTDYDARASLMWCATMALNRLIGVGVPQDWSTHRIGHELTVLYGLDHGQTLAMVLPANMQVMREQKRDKLIQYGRRVWGLTDSAEDIVIDKAIDCTRDFFESLGVSTLMKGYNLDCDIEAVLTQLRRHNLTALGERGLVTLEASRRILEMI